MARVDNDKEYTPAEIAERLGVNRRTVYRWIKAGYLVSVKLGPKLVYIRESALSRFLEGNNAPAAPKPGKSNVTKSPEGNTQPSLPAEMLPTGSGRVIPPPKISRPQKVNKRRS